MTQSKASRNSDSDASRSQGETCTKLRMSAGEEESQRQKAEGRDISRELEPVEDTYQKALSCAKSRRKDNREQGLSPHRAQSDPKERQPRAFNTN